jgi:hypothetical protein
MLFNLGFHLRERDKEHLRAKPWLGGYLDLKEKIKRRIKKFAR